MVFARVEVEGLENVLAAFATLREELSNPTIGLVSATNGVAAVWAANYDAEGSMVGGWADLAQKTQDLRQAKGLDPEHPILFRYGTLRGIVIDLFQKPAASSATATSDSGADISGSLTISEGTATLSASGWPVVNQWEDAAKNRPARPYWFVNPQVEQAALDGVALWLGDLIKGL